MCSESLIMFTMKTLGISLAGRVWLILLYFASTGLCLQRIHCRWGSFGEWSACDPCTKLQSRSRTMVVYAQFDGNLCGGEPNEKRACETTQHCPLGDGCRNRFRCLSGKCISLSLVCNGDQDCEGDSLDEGTCEVRQISCQSAHQTPPNIQNLGVGFDIVTGKERGIVMNTQSFGAQCRHIEGLTTNIVYRVPLSTLSYNYAVKVEKDLSEELFASHWEYSKKNVYRQTVTGTTTGSTFKDSSEKQSRDKKTTLLVLKSNIEVARFQNQAPQYIPISEAFWKALSGLPVVFDYTAYRAIVERFGTHYRSEGSLGGYLKAFMYVSEDRFTASASKSYKYKECDKPKEFILFVPFSRETCSDDEDQTSSRSDGKNDIPLLLKIEVEGGLHITRMYNLDLSEPAKNLIAYSDWADSVISFPVVIKQKLRPLFELVKEVPCAGVKKLHLRRAIEQYDAETHPCHCQPCWNNGLPVREGSKCTCVCKPGTSGVGCQTGSELEGRQGVIHGSWSCWSQWTSCSGNRRSRSRVCSNPSPLNGGLQCIGETSERSECVDQDLEYFRTQEPECFDFSMPPKQKCGPPPVLINGFVLDPKDVYLVGKKLEYRCITGYHLVGNAIIECMEDQTWSQRPGTCEASNCMAAVLTEGVMASPLKGLYRIGEKVTLSCPPGKQVLGETELICDPSLLFSPSPESVRCIEGTIVTARAATAQCQPWEKSSRGKCVCRFPYECMPSLEVCAALTQRGPVLLSVCKLHALQCLGKNHTLIENSFCEWPVRDTAEACGSCGIWEACNDQTNACRCKEASECLGLAVSVCALVGEDDSTPAATMSECEAGRRRCTGEKVTVLSLQPCGPM